MPLETEESPVGSGRWSTPLITHARARKMRPDRQRLVEIHFRSRCEGDVRRRGDGDVMPLGDLVVGHEAVEQFVDLVLIR